MAAQAGDDEDTAVDVSLYGHRWRRFLHPNPRSMDSNRASQEQEQEQEQPEEPGFPGLLSAEETDNSSQIEVGGARRALPMMIAVVVFMVGHFIFKASLFHVDALSHMLKVNGS